MDERAATDELTQLFAISYSLSLSLLYNSPLDDGMLINNRQVKWREIEISQLVTAEPNWVFLHYAFFSAVYRHAVYTRPPLFILLRGAYCTIKPAILLLCDGRKLLKHGPAWFLCVFPSPLLRFPGEDRFISALKSKGKHSCFGPVLSVVALASASHNESLKCERLKMQKHRRRPDTCHPFHPEVWLSHTHTGTCLPLCSIETSAVLLFPHSPGERNGVRRSHTSRSLCHGDAVLRPPRSSLQVTRAGSTVNMSTWMGLVQHAKVEKK